MVLSPPRHKAWCALLPCLSLFLLLSARMPADAAPVKLAASGKALMSVVVGAKASDKVKQAAKSLAEYLGRISSAKFSIVTGDGKTGLIVGLPADFPALPVKVPFDARVITQREDYLLRSHARGVYLLGATEKAVEYAVWDLLYRLGYRQFFPGPTWEVVPSVKNLQIAVDAVERPDYYARRIWYQWGTWSEQSLSEWCVRNRVGLGVDVWNAHSYSGYIDMNRKEFDAHPEYLGLLNGKRVSSKFCISNPELRKLIAASAVRYLRENSKTDSVSVEPDDGGGWCECEACKALGSISDRAVLLANTVAEAVEKEFGSTKVVGMLSYYQHAAPPALKVHPLVNVSVTTAFHSFNVDELISGWHAQGATMGIYDYYSVHTWWRDMPARPTASNLNHLQESIPRFFKEGVRYFSAESGDNWGPNGLGYYFAARMLWDVNEAQKRDALVNDFLEKCFGPAKKPMAEFYRLLDGSNKADQLSLTDTVGRLYRALAAAKKVPVDAKITARIDQLIFYVRYVDMYNIYTSSKDEARQQAYEAMLRFAYRVGKTGMMHSLPLWEEAHLYDAKVKLPKEADWQVAEGKNPWKDTTPLTGTEATRLLAEGVKNNPTLPFTPIRYSTNLVPATPLKLPRVPTGFFRSLTAYPQTFYTWVAKDQREINVKMNGECEVKLYAGAVGKIPIERLQVKKKVAVQAQPTDEDIITLHPKASGLHRIERSGAYLNVLWEESMPMTFPTDGLSLNWSEQCVMYFYVPKGTKLIAAYVTCPYGKMLDSSGKERRDLSKHDTNYIGVKVPEGEDGKLWKLQNYQGIVHFYTIPPYIARNGDELLLPEEVVKADTPKETKTKEPAK